jgi:hypothetical protein
MMIVRLCDLHWEHATGSRLHRVGHVVVRFPETDRSMFEEPDAELRALLVPVCCLARACQASIRWQSEAVVAAMTAALQMAARLAAIDLIVTGMRRLAVAVVVLVRFLLIVTARRGREGETAGLPLLLPDPLPNELRE